MGDNPIVQVYSQECPHEEAFIVGTKDGLTRLRQAIDEALEKSVSHADVFVSDGEGYTLGVLLNEADWIAKEWCGLKNPYTHEIFKEHREDCVWPDNLYWERTNAHGTASPIVLAFPSAAKHIDFKMVIIKLLEYAQHTASCAKSLGANSTNACTCGVRDAMAEAKKTIE